MQADAEAEKKPMQVMCVMRDFICVQVCLDCIFMVYLSSFVVSSIFSALVTQFSENKIKDTIQRFFLVFCCSSYRSLAGHVLHFSFSNVRWLRGQQNNTKGKKKIRHCNSKSGPQSLDSGERLPGELLGIRGNPRGPVTTDRL